MIIFLLILLLLYIINNCKKETFKNYRNIVVSPKYSVYNPNKVIFLADKLNTHIFNKSYKHFPIEKYEIVTEDIISEVNNKKNLIGITDFHLYMKFIKDNPKSNIRFICNLFSNTLTILMKNKDISDEKKICVEFKNSPEYVILNIIQKYYPLKIIILNKIVPFNKLNLILSENECNYFAKFITHPDEQLKKFLKLNSDFEIVGFMNKKLFPLIIPDFNKSVINMTYYGFLNSIDSINNKKILICHSELDSDTSYNIINTIYTNFNSFKNTNDKSLKSGIQYFQISDIFAPNINEIKLHLGVDAYYREKGYISDIDRNICRKLVGKQNCDTSIRLNPYRIL